jgi:hypothetical protein
VSPLGIDPETVRLVAQCLDHYAIAGPTATDATTNFFSNHPIRHKIAAFRYITRVHSLPLTPKRKQKECTIIQDIAKTNNFPHTLIQTLNSQLQHGHNYYDRNNNSDRDINNWTTFTY